MQHVSEDIIYKDDAVTLDGLFVKRVRRSPRAVAYRAFERTSGAWVDSTWEAMSRQVAVWQAALAAEGLTPGDRVALCVRNGPDWVTFDQAALGLGLVVVPLYMDDRPDAVAYILRDAAVSLLLVQDANHWRRLAPAVTEVESLERIVVLGDGERPRPEEPRLRSSGEWLPPGPHSLRERRGDPHALATIVYTSGTTGRPKGVMLNHANILSIAHSALTMVSVRPEDIFLSLLPLSHTLERTAGYYLPMMAGSAVAYARSIPQLAEDLRTIRPTLMVAVPRVFERIYTRLQHQLIKGPRYKRALFRAAVAVGWRRFQYDQGRAGWSAQFVALPLLRRLVSAPVMERLGGRLRLVVSGGAALSPEIARNFIGLGLTLLQGYGLTETSPVISVNLPEDNEPASVGVALRGVQVRIGEDDELLAKGPGVMLGYWNNHAATAATIDPDGWLHTGDQARIDERGHIYITGRIKDVLVLSNGEKVPPAYMEMAIELDPLFEQVMVVGEGRSYLTALVVLNGDLWPGFAQDLGLDPMEKASLASKRARQAVLSRVTERLHDFPSYAKIRRAHLSLEPWTVDNGLLTPTLKVKRARVLERHAAAIAEMYAG